METTNFGYFEKLMNFVDFWHVLFASYGYILHWNTPIFILLAFKSTILFDLYGIYNYQFIILNI